MGEQVIVLPDSRILGYQEYGDPTGAPVFFCHGYPGSSADFQFVDPRSVAVDLRVRVIAISRPGYGASTAQPDRALLDFPADVAVLADRLGIDRFAVTGYSGGGPYALACAHLLPDRVTAVGLIAGLGPPDAPGMATSLGAMYTTAPPPLRWVLMQVMGIGAKLLPDQVALLGARLVLPGSDRAALADPVTSAGLMATYRRAFARGAAGGMRDAAIYSRPWGFELGSVTTPVFLWHGIDDVNVRVSVGQYVAQALPHCHAQFVPGEGHVSINLYTAAILDAVASH